MTEDDIKKLIVELRCVADVQPRLLGGLLSAAADALEKKYRQAEHTEAWQSAALIMSEQTTAAESERDALRSTIQGVLSARDMEWDLPPAARERLSRAIDMKGGFDG